MNKKKLLPLIILIAVFIAAVTATVFVIRGCNDKEQVTITFETNGGSKIDPITINKGEKLKDVPQAYLAGNSFDGWYVDEKLNEAFRVDTEIEKDTTLYAGYTLIAVDVNVTKPTTQYAEDVKEDHSVTIITTTSYTAEEFLKAIKIEGVSTVMPYDMPEELDESLPKTIDGWFDVAISGNEYTVKPKKIVFNSRDTYAYVRGKFYKITIPANMHFKDFEDSVLEYSFRIEADKKDEALENVEYKNEEGLLFVNKEEIKNLEDIIETKKDENALVLSTEITTFLKDASGYYNLLFSETVYKKYEFKAGDILCIGDGEGLNTESLFVKVCEVYGQAAPASSGESSEGAASGTGIDAGKGEYLVLAQDADVSEVFENIDVNYDKPIGVDEIINGLDTEEMTQMLKTNGSMEKVTNLMTGLLMASDEVQAAYTEDYKATNKLSGDVDPNTGLPIFCSNTYITNEKKLLNVKLLEDAEVSISIGVGHNPNFDSAYTDDFVALKIVFSYETTIKDRLQVNAEIVFTQFLAASAQGYLEYKMGWFKLKWAEFDAAINLYSQTDFDFKILVRTIKPDGIDHNDGNDNGGTTGGNTGNNGGNTGNNNNNNDNNNKNDGADEDSSFVDIADKIAEKLKGDEGDDPNNLVAELRDMLDSEDGYLELFRAPILRIPIDIIPGIPVMRVTVKLDFVIEMNFAAGFSAHMSVLEAVQVGVKGDTRTKTISSYKHDNLPGGNQYAVQLSACGYLGVRAGFEGGLSIGFCGLSSLGDVGVYVYVGPYVDIYGFAQATFAKQGGVVSQSLVGGYYVEIGIFLEITLEARSDMFGVKVGVTLLDKKWPIVSFGNKEVLIYIEQGELDNAIYVENKGEETASISLDLLPKLKGHYLDITTGEVTDRDVPWEKVTLKMSANNFSYDPYNGVINYRSKPGLDKLGSETCIATYHYNGSILQFNASAEKYKEFYPFAQTTIIYYDSSKIDKEDAGKMVKVKFYSEIDGKKELMQEQEAMIGETIRGYATLDYYKYVNITWDKVPHETMITDEGMEFTCTGDPRQVYTAFIYYDVEKDVWVTDIRACDLGEVPVAPEIPEKEDKLAFTGWRGQDGINVQTKIRVTPSDHVGPTITADDLSQYGFFTDTTFGKDPTKSVAFYVPEENNDWMRYEELTDPDHQSEGGWTWYYTVISIYVAEYDYDDCVFTIYNSDADGNQKIDTENVSYRGYPTGYHVYSPLSRDFVGFALEEGGEVVYKDLSDIGCLRHDVTVYAVYEEKAYEVNLYKYDAATNQYSLYKKIERFGGGKQLSELGEDLAAIKIADNATAEGVLECKFVSLHDVKDVNDFNEYTYLSDKNLCVRPLNIYPIFSRTVKVVFDANGGKILPDGDSEYEYYAESELNYVIKDFPLACVKDAEDSTRYECEHVGWENQATGEKIYFKDYSNATWGGYYFEATCSVPTTLKAIYEETERTNFSVYIKTPYGTLKDGKSTVIDLKNLTYDQYDWYRTEYAEWFPADYRDEENHCTWRMNGRNQRDENGSYRIEYIPSKLPDKFTVDVDYNGGRQDVGCATSKYIDVAWETEIDLSTQKVIREEDEYGTWKAKHWTDEAGNVYALDGTYTVRGDDTLTLIWEIVTYKEYNIYFTIKDETDKIISSYTKTYHKGESLASIGNPEEADGKVFSGWTWKHWNYLEIEGAPLSEMPAEDLRLEGKIREVKIIYILDDREIDRSAGRVGYEETVKDNYVIEGYTVTPWATTDVSVTDGKFTMPGKDVTFTATSSKNSYKLTYYHNDEVYIEEQTVAYGTLVRLPNLPIEEGVEYVWVSGDVEIYDIGFYMPANDVIVQTTVYESVKYVIYYLNDEIVGYQRAQKGQRLNLLDLSQDEKYAGATFSGWYTEDATINEDSTLIVGTKTVRVYGYFTQGTTKVNIYFDENKSSPDLVLYANDGDTLKVAFKPSGKEISGYKINGTVTSEITVSGTAEINAYVQCDAKKYQVSYDDCGYGFTLPETASYAAGTRVDLPALPTTEYVEGEGWFTVEVEILQDTDGSLYFIMPETDVIIGVKVKQDVYEEEYKTANVYLNLPNVSQPVFYKTYKVYVSSDTFVVNFDIPKIDGYEFVCWKDEDGNPLDKPEYGGLTYSGMTKNECSYYGEYRKLELHIIEFRINNEVVGYGEFYDSYSVIVKTPIVELQEGEEFSGWFNELVNPYYDELSNVVRFETGYRPEHEYAKTDFVFNGYIYRAEGAYEATLMENAYDEAYKFHVNLDTQIKLSGMLNGHKVKYEEVWISYNGGASVNLVYSDCVQKSGDEYIIIIPSFDKLKEILEVDALEITGFSIIARVDFDNADSAPV